MVDRGAGIDDVVRTKLSVRLNDSACHHDRAGADSGRGGYPRVRVDDDLPVERQHGREVPPRGIAPYGHDRGHARRNLRRRPEDTYAESLLAVHSIIIVVQAGDDPPGSPRRLNHDLRVASCTDDMEPLSGASVHSEWCSAVATSREV